MLSLQEVPKYESLLECGRDCPGLAPSAIEAFLHVLRTSTDLLKACDAVHARHGLSQGRFMVLLLLSRAPEGRASPAGLAERADVTRATMTGLTQILPD